MTEVVTYHAEQEIQDVEERYFLWEETAVRAALEVALVEHGQPLGSRVVGRFHGGLRQLEEAHRAPVAGAMRVFLRPVPELGVRVRGGQAPE